MLFGPITRSPGCGRCTQWALHETQNTIKQLMLNVILTIAAAVVPIALTAPKSSRNQQRAPEQQSKVAHASSTPSTVLGGKKGMKHNAGFSFKTKIPIGAKLPLKQTGPMPFASKFRSILAAGSAHTSPIALLHLPPIIIHSLFSALVG